MMLRRAILFSAVFSAGLALSVSSLAGAPARIVETGASPVLMADVGHASPRAGRKARGAGRRTGYLPADPLVIPGIYRRDMVAQPAARRARGTASARRAHPRGFREVERGPSLLVVPGKPLPFQPGCTEDSNSDHLGEGWFKVVVKKTCFVR